jgi:tetratricopeptide (TPR) repeat protein
MRAPMLESSLARRAFPWLALVAVGALVYGRALLFGFTFYDDAPLLVDHHTQVADPRTAVASFFRDAFALLGPESRAVFYRPLLWFSYLLDARIGGVRPGVYHATNLLLHLVACGLVYTLLRRFGHGALLALGLALLLCVHPALASIVGWIPCRNDSLLAIFAVLSLFALLRFLEQPSAMTAGLVLLGVAAALFTKESGMALLAVLPAAAIALRRRAVGMMLPRLLGLCAGVAAVALGWMLLRRIALGDFSVGFGSLAQHLPMAIVYVGKTFVPVQLSVYPSRGDTSLLPGLLGLLLLAGLVFALRRHLLGRAGLGLVWYFAFLAPALLVAEETQGFEHRLYVPLIGLLIALAELPQELPQALRRTAALTFVALLCAAALVTFRRLPDFASDTRFWESAARTSPSSEAVWRTLAWRQFEQGRLEEAEASARRGLALRPDEARGHLLLGVALARQGRLADAEPALLRAVELDPGNADAWQNLALLQRQTGQPGASAISRQRAQEARER